MISGLYISLRAFIKEIVSRRHLIMQLARRNLRQQFEGSYLGMAWNVMQPLIFTGILWLVFSIGLRGGGGRGGVPFVVYLITGMAAWQFFSANLGRITGVVKSHSYLVKQMNFSLGIVPVAYLMSALVAHGVFTGIAVIIAGLNGFFAGFYLLQLVYYSFALLMLLLGLGWISSSTSIFVEDVGKIVSIIAQFGFWLTPVLWDMKSVPEAYRWIVKLNPMAYIVDGFRASIIRGEPFWADPLYTVYFWGVTALLLLTGAIVFKRLRPHFAEVL
ncbi:MAG: ABC transporter permease [Candidatus Kapaibacterium sp.]